MKLCKKFVCIILVLCTTIATMCVNSLAARRKETHFKDVEKDEWFFDAVEYVCAKRIMNGRSEESFAPNDKTTRGMIVTVLYRLERSPEVGTSCPFRDVAEDAYCRDPVIWASENQIVNGVSTERFDPNGAVTREQLATILYRYAQYKGYSVKNVTALDSFSDRNQIGSYAASAMQWAVAEGILSGFSTTELQPKACALRAQVAMILMRFCEGTADGMAESDSNGERGKNNPRAGRESDEKADRGNASNEQFSETLGRDGFVFSVETVEVAAGTKDISVPIRVQNNPGILGMRVSVSYDESVLTLSDASNGDAVVEVLTLTKAKALCSGCSFVWDGIEIDSADVKDGTILLLRFRVSDSAKPGSYPITVHYKKGDIIDNNLQTICPRIQNGSITIK